MNEIEQLAAVSDLDAAGLVSEDAFADLADRIAAQPKQWAPARLRWRPIGLAIAATVTAAALAAGSILAVHDRSARFGASPRPSVAVRSATTAAQLVAYATRDATAESFDPRPHQWLYTDILSANTTRHGRGSAFKPAFKPVAFQSWARLDGEGYAFLQGCKIYRDAFGGPFTRGHGVTVFGWPDLRYSYLDSLPSRPARLTAIIRSNLGAKRMKPVDAEVAVFRAVEVLLEDVVVLPPRLQAGLYGVLAQDPAVRFHPSVTDYAGHTGAAFSTSLDKGDTEDLIVVSTRTYAYMGLEQVALRKFTQTEADGPYTYHKGQVLTLQAVLAARIVQHLGQRS